MTKREKNLLYVAFLFLVVAIYALVVMPYMGETQVKLTETETINTQIDMQNQQIAMIPDLEAQVEENTKNLDDMKHTYDDVQTQEEITTYFTELAESKNMLITSFAQTRTSGLLEERGLALYPLAEVALSFRGTHEDYIALVDELNQNDDVTVLTLRQATQGSKPVVQEYNITCLFLMNAD